MTLPANTPRPASATPPSSQNHQARRFPGRTFEKPILPQAEIERRITVAQDNAKRLMVEALQNTPAAYRNFIVPIGQWKKVAESGEREIKAYIELPYMSVDGRVCMAMDEHLREQKKLAVGPALFINDEVSGQKLCQVTVKSEIRGEATGHARLNIGGGGADRSNPVENAETSAIGRALGFLGYGCFGTGIASADEMIAACGGEIGPSGDGAATNGEGERKPATTSSAPATATSTSSAPATSVPGPSATRMAAPTNGATATPAAEPVVAASSAPVYSEEATRLIVQLGLREGEATLLRSQVESEDEFLSVLRSKVEARAETPGTPAPAAPTAPAPANADETLRAAVTDGSLSREQLALAAERLLRVAPTAYQKYLHRTFNAAPEALTDAQLAKEIGFLQRRLANPDQGERFRQQCERLGGDA